MKEEIKKQEEEKIRKDEEEKRKFREMEDEKNRLEQLKEHQMIEEELEKQVSELQLNDVNRGDREDCDIEGKEIECQLPVWQRLWLGNKKKYWLVCWHKNILDQVEIYATTLECI